MKQALRLWLLEHHPEVFSMRLRFSEMIGTLGEMPISEDEREFSRMARELFDDVVQGGPFEGMKLRAEAICSAKLPKILGTYERELADLTEQAIERNYQTIINVGAAEGYYAVGMAVRCPNSKVIAVDPLKMAHEVLIKVAEDNGVADRIRTETVSSTGRINSWIEGETFVLMDCEGAEFGLLNPSKCPGYASCDILVEVHEFVRPGLADALRSRFEPTHSISVIEQEKRDGLTVPALEKIPAELRGKVLSEKRPKRLNWMYFERKNG